MPHPVYYVRIATIYTLRVSLLMKNFFLFLDNICLQNTLDCFRNSLKLCKTCFERPNDGGRVRAKENRLMQIFACVHVSQFPNLYLCCSVAALTLFRYLWDVVTRCQEKCQEASMNDTMRADKRNREKKRGKSVRENNDLKSFLNQKRTNAIWKLVFNEQLYPSILRRGDYNPVFYYM